MNFICVRIAQVSTLQISFVLVALSLLPAKLLASDHDDWANRMRSITPRTYLCRRASAAIVIDGKLNESAWDSAPWTEDFVDIQGETKPKPRLRTRAKMLWDDNFLYLAAELEEPHVWATLTNHDSVIFRDPDFELFIDPAGQTEPYYEFEMNALNTTWDLRLDKPYMDGGKPHNEWEIPGAKTAVVVRGTLNNPSDRDGGWTVELALPWKVLSEHALHPGPPLEAEQWRIDFSRVEWETTINKGSYQTVPHRPEDNWVWSPTGVIDMHRPEMWGLVQFTTRASSDEPPVAPISGKSARDLALGVYYAQRDFFKEHGRWSTNLMDLAERPRELPPGVENPVLESSPDGYTCSVQFEEHGRRRVWRIRQDRLLTLDAPLPLESASFIRQAAAQYGELGRRAAYFLVDNMSAEDRGRLSCEFLMENLALALDARTNFPWAKVLPERMFFNEVLPYACLDETRDLWRTEFRKLAGELVRDCKTSTEAAQTLNRELFQRIKVHYNLARKRNNQSPLESMDQGKATCTGLAIILVDACRAVGVPARIAGVPEWADKAGNHTWVEIWDGDWFFTGADEYDKAGLNRAWFNNDAARTARSEKPLNQIYASSWRRTGQYFPLAWDADSREIHAVNVSARYASLPAAARSSGTVVHVRLRTTENGERLPAEVQMRSAADEVLARNTTRAGTADLNDMPDFTLPRGVAEVVFRFMRNGEAREKVVPCASCANSHTLDFVWNDLSPVPASLLAAETWLERPARQRGPVPDPAISRQDVPRLVGLAWGVLGKEHAASAGKELAEKEIVIGNKSLRWMEKTFGDAPDGKHSLWITLHGGGQGTAEENDRGWKGYFGRYEFPPGSINAAPRAPANTWDMWHVQWVDELLDRLIGDMVLERGVDPARVYLIGYSAGGDGVYQLAPRMADRFAAAGMCAGHPNSVTPEGLRNLPFFLYMGGEDSAYHRNEVVREFSAKMDGLQAADTDGYFHRLTVYPGLAHNMEGREAEMLPRMVELRRVAWPKRVVWKENDNFMHHRFYWLERAASATNPNEVYAAHVEGQTITIETPGKGNLILRLSDALLDLDQPIRVVAGGRSILERTVRRSLPAIVQSFQERQDPDTAATVLLPVEW